MHCLYPWLIWCTLSLAKIRPAVISMGSVSVRNIGAGRIVRGSAGPFRHGLSVDDKVDCILHCRCCVRSVMSRFRCQPCNPLVACVLSISLTNKLRYCAGSSKPKSTATVPCVSLLWSRLRADPDGACLLYHELRLQASEYFILYSTSDQI